MTFTFLLLYHDDAVIEFLLASHKCVEGCVAHLIYLLCGLIIDCGVWKWDLSGAVGKMSVDLVFTRKHD